MTKTNLLIVVGSPAERAKLAKQTAIDLNMVQSKFIGETEKNLAQLFASANKAGAVLIFDEADALFGKRTDMKDSHDKYAELERLLDGFRGTVILAVADSSTLPPSLLQKARIVRAGNHWPP